MPDDYLDNLSADERAQMWADAVNHLRPHQLLDVVRLDSVVAGFAVSGPESGGGYERHTGQLFAINLEPEYSGRGLGRMLLKHVTAELSNEGFGEAVLWVVPENARAIGLYESEQWNRDGAARNDEVLGVVVSEVRFRRQLVA